MPVTAPGAEIEIQSQQEIEIQSQLGVSCAVVAIETQSQQGDPSCLDLTKSAGLQLRLSLNWAECGDGPWASVVAVWVGRPQLCLSLCVRCYR